MGNPDIVPCLWFDDQAESAASFYTRTFPAGRITAVSRFPEGLANPSGKPPGSVLTVELEIAGQRFTALNGGPQFVLDPSISFFVHVETVEEAERLFEALSDGGQALMPLDAYPWSPRYAWVQDRFGVSWQVMTMPRKHGEATVAPCLMFAGAQHGKAEEAMHAYAGIFPGGRVTSLERYGAGEGPEGTVKHGRFLLGAQEMIAMDSHLAHGLHFSEAISLQVMCDDQAEVDHFWTALSAGGSEGPCGWLKDRFGLSWQVVPRQLVAWLTSEDKSVQVRAFKAMLAMKKPDIAALEAAIG